MPEALQLVRRMLGEDATLLQAREVRNGLLGWLPGGRQVEVLASADVQVPSRLPVEDERVDDLPAVRDTPLPDVRPLDDAAGLRSCDSRPLAWQPSQWRATDGGRSGGFRADDGEPFDQPPSLIEELSRPPTRLGPAPPPDPTFRLFAELMDAGLHEAAARDLVDRACQASGPHDAADLWLLKARVLRLVEDEIRVCEPLVVRPGQRRLVAVVGPTGVGKTTTVAKLAAHYRLRERRRVGLISIDTPRLAAAEQLRNYAEIIGLPFEVAATARELRTAIDRLSEQELILVDTAGRSPRDEIKLRELESLLGECRADAVYLALSCASAGLSLRWAAAQFGSLGITALLLTKLDEASGLGGLLPVLRETRLPISYLTDGQDVPDDIQAADRRKLARLMLGIVET